MNSLKVRLWTASALVAFAMLLCTTARVSAIDYPEVEPNNSKAAATIPGAPLVAGDSLSGNTTGSSTTVEGPTSADYFLVQTGALSLGVYEHRLVITTAGTAGHTGTIRVLSQTSAAADTLAGIPWDGVTGSAGTADNAGQTSSTATTPPRYVKWYGFGKQEQIYFRVTGTGSTTTDYAATLETFSIAPIDIGSFDPGQITINMTGQGHTTDTDFWVYDSNFDAITGYGNDDANAALGGAPVATTALQSWLARTYAPGVYYIAVSNFSLTNNQPAASDDNFRTGALADFPDAVFNSSLTVNLNLKFTISDGVNSVEVPNTKLSQFDVNWFKFTVLPAEGSCCLADASCVETSASGCNALNGVFNFGLTCGETTCVGMGACCVGATCTVQTQLDCDGLSGTYEGDGTDCDPNPCVGACCITSLLECQDLTEAECLAASGIYQGDGTNCLDVNCGFCQCTLVVNVFPHYENFEASATCGTGCNPVCNLASDWTNLSAPDDNGEWAVDVGGTTSAGTGPSVDFDPGTSAGKYVYTESSSCNNRTAILLSPCYDLTVLTSPEFSFAYHMFGAVQGSLFVEVSTDGCVSWTEEFSVIGQNIDQWFTQTISLAAYQASSNVRIRIRGVTAATDFTSDMAVDALLVQEAPTEGACCTGINCTIETPTSCSQLGGIFQGLGTGCDPTPCSGACCHTDGSCTDEADDFACINVGGTFFGIGSTCGSVFCGGACCHVDGTCTDEFSANSCGAAGGVFQGAGTDCGSAQCPQPNDDCVNAIPLVLGVSVFGNNVGAIDDGAPTCGTTSPNQGLWYSIAGTGNTMTVTTCMPGTDFDTMLQVWCGCDLVFCVGGDDDADAPFDPACEVPSAPGINRASRFSWCSQSGQDYFIHVGGFSSTSGNFELIVTDDGVPCANPAACSPPENDDCFNATEILAVPFTDSAAHFAAFGDIDVGCNAGANVETRHGVWWTYTPTANCLATISETSTNDTVTAIFTGPDCNSLSEIQCSDPETSTIAMSAGTQYWILVGMWSSTTVPTTPVSITFDCLLPPANDECAGATEILTVPYFDSANHITATPDVDVACNAAANTETRHGVWWTYTPAADCLGTISETSTNDTVTAVFTGADCNTLTEIQCSDPESSTIAMSAGTQYWILVGMFSATTVPTTPVSITFDCLEPTGQCCVAETCSIETQTNCVSFGGVYGGNDTTCEGDLVFVDNNVYAIPDNDPAGVSSSLAVPAVDVTDVVVEITFAPEHAWLGDMIATLTYDDGIGGIITADLFARVGRGEQITSGSPFGNGNDMNGLYRFGDAFLLNLWTEPAVGGDQPQGDYRASTNNNSGLTTYPDNGTFVDLNTVFGGPKAAGTWTLKIADVGAALTGSFSWKLVLNGGGDSPCAADCACLGDTDASLTLDGNDVASFTQAILDGNGECADVNEDTFVNLDDVDPFVMKLIMGETCE